MGYGSATPLPIDGASRVAPARAGGEVPHYDWRSSFSHSSNPVRSGVRTGKAGTGTVKRTAVRGLEGWLSRELGEPVCIESAERVGGGTGREIWKVAVTIVRNGEPRRLLRLVRGETAPGSETGLSRAGEFAVLRAAHEAGVLVPRPLLLCDDADVFVAPFFVTEFVQAKVNTEPTDGDSGGRGGMFPLLRASSGETPGPSTLGCGLPNPDIAAQWGREIAKLHRITPQQAPLRALNEAPREVHGTRIDRYRRRLDMLGDPQPVLEWVMRQLERNAPEGTGTVLCHGAPGASSCVVEDDELVAILDWQWSRWSDPYEDIGEYCATCRRLALPRHDGTVDTARSGFFDGYRQESRRNINGDMVRYWEVMATLGRAVAALEQGHRFVAGGEGSVELALRSRRVAEMEIDLLAETDRLAMEHAHA